MKRGLWQNYPNVPERPERISYSRGYVCPTQMPRSSNRGDSPLEHPTRRALFDAIHATPGRSLPELAEVVGVPHSTARHHARVLTDDDLVVAAKRLGKRRFFPDRDDPLALLAALAEPAKASVLDALAEYGEAHCGLLAARLDRDPSTITHHLQTLEDADLVEREKRGRTVVNRLDPAVDALLETRPRRRILHDRSGYQESSASDDAPRRWTAPNNRTCRTTSQRLSHRNL